MASKLNICIDITSLSQKLTGIGYYTRNLVKALGELDTENNYCLFGGHYWHSYKERLENYSSLKQTNFRLYTRRLPNKLLLHHGLIPIEFFVGHIDIFHGTNYVLPTVRKAKRIVTVHDMSFEINPDWYSHQTRKWKKSIYKSVVESDKIIAISNSTKNDIIQLYNINPEKIVVIYYGAPADINIDWPDEKRCQIKKKFSLPEKFFLFVGALEPRKNITKILEAFKTVKKMGLGHKLVLVGPKGWRTEEIISYIDKLDIKQDTIFCGYIGHAELPIIYNLAEALVFPSLCEGFGLPLLEAMAYSTPVITSNVSSLPEIAGDSALLVDPYDSEQIADTMYRFATDRVLRQEYINKGKNRVKQFSWEKAAEQTLKLYLDLVH